MFVIALGWFILAMACGIYAHIRINALEKRLNELSPAEVSAEDTDTLRPAKEKE